MSTVNLIARTVAAIKPPKTGRVEYWDESLKGFGLRVSDRGRKSWVVLYRHNGRPRRLTLGTYPVLSLGDAREQAMTALRNAALGGDPAGEKSAARKAETFGEMAEDYIRLHAKPKKKSWYKDQQALDNHLLPRFKSRKAVQVTRRDIISMLDDIKEAGSPIQANRTLEIVRRIYNWGISREIVKENPCTKVEKPGVEQTRDRVLTDKEIKKVWDALGQESKFMCGMYRLRFLTAQRGGEISQMRRVDIDHESKWWTIPAKFSKNGKAHRVPLCDAALKIIEDAIDMGTKSEWVFPSPTTGGPIESIWKSASRVRKNSGVEFRPHDIRRTVASKMTGDLEISRLVVSKILNHVEKGVTAVYDRASYDKDKRIAIDSWGGRLAEIIQGKAEQGNKVVLLRKA